MTKGRAVTFIRSRQIGWIEKKQQVPFDFAQGRLSTALRFGPTARRGRPDDKGEGGDFYCRQADFAQSVNLPPGSNYLYLGVWDMTTGRMGTVNAAVDVKKPTGTGAADF
jgi:hypothetical protein